MYFCFTFSCYSLAFHSLCAIRFFFYFIESVHSLFCFVPVFSDSLSHLRTAMPCMCSPLVLCYCALCDGIEQRQPAVRTARDDGVCAMADALVPSPHYFQLFVFLIRCSCRIRSIQCCCRFVFSLVNASANAGVRVCWKETTRK